MIKTIIPPMMQAATISPVFAGSPEDDANTPVVAPTDCDGVLLGDGVFEGDIEWDGVLEGDRDGDGDGVGVELVEGVFEGEGDELEEGVTEAEGVGDGEGKGVRLL
jgi:hypothetical protein